MHQWLRLHTENVMTQCASFPLLVSKTTRRAAARRVMNGPGLVAVAFVCALSLVLTQHQFWTLFVITFFTNGRQEREEMEPELCNPYPCYPFPPESNKSFLSSEDKDSLRIEHVQSTHSYSSWWDIPIGAYMTQGSFWVCKNWNMSTL